MNYVRNIKSLKKLFQKKSIVDKVSVHLLFEIESQNCPKQRIKNRHFSLLCYHAFKVSPGKIELLECLPSCSSQLFVTFRNSTFKIMKIHATFVRSTLSGPSVRHSAAGQNASCMFLILANLSLLKIIRAEHRAACSAPSWVAVESTAERRSKARAPFKNARDC